jgi:hypothetical protein
LDATAAVDLDMQLGSAAEVSRAFERERVVFGQYVDGVALLNKLVERVIDGNLVMPKGFSYEGNGIYSVDADNGVLAQVRFYQAKTTSFGVEGDPITFNLFDATNYFSGIKVSSSVEVSFSGIDTNSSISFGSSGPGVELLGLSAAPKSPLKVNVDDMTAELVKTTSDVRVRLEPAKDDVVQVLDVSSSKTSSNAINNDLALSVTDFSAGNTEIEQTLSLETTKLQLVESGDGYTGNLSLAASSPSFSFDALLRFEASTDAIIAFGCHGATLAFPDD